ncbi:MAG: glycosyl transferase family 1, partial [Clostridia bacterium]|nr:glycosyl transferase family 1 [Clostridia bacterium]
MKLDQIIYAPLPNEDKRLISNDDELNKKVIFSHCFNKIDRLFYLHKIKKIFNDIVKKIKIEEIDLIHAHSMFINGGVAFLIKRAFGVRYITAVRSTDVNIFMKWGFFLRKWYINILL